MIKKKPAPRSPAVTAEASEFIEEMGLTFEKTGMPRMAGRILGHLLICDPPTQSLDQMGQALGASKASISTMSKLLLNGGFIKRVGVSGDRRDYLTLKVGTFEDIVTRQIHDMMSFRKILAKALAILEKEKRTDTHHLHEFLELYEFMRKKMPEMLAQWQRERKK
ncbi:MAG: MarR family transcriptional regulator [Spirochaetes bacterium]|nr:MarR family transcriptional regulator [Spirochaetota bacterium]